MNKNKVQLESLRARVRAVIFPREQDDETVCVCVCERERGRERLSVFVCVCCERERERVCLVKKRRVCRTHNFFQVQKYLDY